MDTKETARPSAAPLGFWGEDSRIAQALSEQETCMRAVYGLADGIIRPPADSPPEFDVRMGVIPPAFFTSRRNIFSTLFYLTYMALGIAKPRRLLYGKLNHLFRIWVTGADNLLDEEDKCVLPLVIPGSSRVMREVVAIMAADRVLWHILNAAVVESMLTTQQADALADESLRCLLPSAAQEAGEESGVVTRPDPDYVLRTIHLFKTGLLFNIPFTGIDVIESDVDAERLARLKRALRLFGGGCQILDDVRDMARDFVERRHNYVLSVLERDKSERMKSWEQRAIKPEDRLYFEVLPESLAAAELGFRQLVEACTVLRDEGVIAAAVPVEHMAFSMFAVLDLEDLSHACSFVK